MHTIHYIAVEADSKEDAFSTVQSLLINEEGSSFADWSDWHIVGGGRWNTTGSQYHDDSTDVVSFAEYPQKFLEILGQVKKWRIEELNRMLEQMDFDKFKSDIVEYISNDCIMPHDRKYDLNSYYIKSAVEMTRDYYSSDSHFYDTVGWYGADMSDIYRRIGESELAQKQYLVPVDFHF